MLKKTIKYKDLDGNDVVEDFYFNMTKAELIELEANDAEGMTGRLERIAASKDNRLIMQTFKEILATTVGKRSEDGKRFIKNQEITDAFMQSDAYSELVLELMQDAMAMANFVVGSLPSDMAGKVEAIAKEKMTELGFTPRVVDLPAENIEVSASEPASYVPPAMPLPAHTDEELLALPQKEFDSLYGTDPKAMNRRILQIAFQRKMQGL